MSLFRPHPVVVAAGLAFPVVAMAPYLAWVYSRPVGEGAAQPWVDVLLPLAMAVTWGGVAMFGPALVQRFMLPLATTVPLGLLGMMAGWRHHHSGNSDSLLALAGPELAGLGVGYAVGTWASGLTGSPDGPVSGQARCRCTVSNVKMRYAMASVVPVLGIFMAIDFGMAWVPGPLTFGVTIFLMIPSRTSLAVHPGGVLIGADRLRQFIPAHHVVRAIGSPGRARRRGGLGPHIGVRGTVMVDQRRGNAVRIITGNDADGRGVPLTWQVEVPAGEIGAAEDAINDIARGRVG